MASHLVTSDLPLLVHRYSILPCCPAMHDAQAGPGASTPLRCTAS